MMKKTLLTFFIILSIVGICFLWKKNFFQKNQMKKIEKKVEIEMEMTENDKTKFKGFELFSEYFCR